MEMRTYPDMTSLITHIYKEIAQWVDNSDIGGYTVSPTIGVMCKTNKYWVCHVNNK